MHVPVQDISLDPEETSPVRKGVSHLYCLCTFFLTYCHITFLCVIHNSDIKEECEGLLKHPVLTVAEDVPLKKNGPEFLHVPREIKKLLNPFSPFLLTRAYVTGSSNNWDGSFNCFDSKLKKPNQIIVKLTVKCDGSLSWR